MAIYRESALDKLSSPEQLDRLVRITSPRSWLILAFSGLIVTAVVIWGLFGSIPTKLQAQGILISSRGTRAIISDKDGRVTDISIDIDSYVHPGDKVLRTDQSELIRQISELEDDFLAVKSYTIESSASGPDELPAVLLDLFIIKQEYGAGERFLAERSALLDRIGSEMDKLKNKLRSSAVVSEVEGKVVSVSIDKGDHMIRGQEIARVMEKGSSVSDSEVIFYIPIEQGRQVSPGMTVNVYPTTVNRQEYGHMTAIVTNVSGYAVTSQQLRRELGNEELAERFMELGVVLEVRADLKKDSSTASGFYWSSRKGAKVELQEGTICDASIVIDSSTPFSLIIPGDW